MPRGGRLPVVDDALARRFEALVFDWDGTAVADRHADATQARAAIEGLSALGCSVAVVTGTDVSAVDGQLAARPHGPGRVVLALDKGSEMSEVGTHGPSLVYRRDATVDEDA